jgi:pimeloyl-ACP methyl ester carboxylesterase
VRVRATPQRRTLVAGGHRLGYQECGAQDGPALLLLHGLASDSDTWDRVLVPLGERGVRVIALDLLGHGASDKPVGAYTLDDFADSLEQFLSELDVGPVTVGGHSLGGAIAIHFGYHYPARVERLVLVAAGGLGREVHPALRAAAVPGAERVLGLAMRRRLQPLYGRRSVHRALGLTSDNLVNLRRARRSLGNREGRAVFFTALRSVIAPAGQRGSFLEMRYLAEQVPTLLVWSEHDPVIPLAHARATVAHLPGSRLVVLPGGGHEPHRRHPDLFAAAVADFVLTS